MNRLPHWLAALALSLLILLVFARLFTAEFVEWDDPLTIANNPAFNPPTWSAIGKCWNPRHAELSLYIPLTQSVWGLLASVAGVEQSDGAPPALNPWIFHSANVLIHLATSLIVLHILRSLTGNRIAAWFGAAVFALHPVQVEAVAWASGTKDVLCGFFTFVSIAILIHHRAKPGLQNIIVMTATVVAACLSKPTGIVAPAMMLIVDVVLLKTPLRRLLATLAPSLFIACGFAIVAKVVQPPVMGDRAALWARPLIATDAMAFYMAKLLWPAHLAIDYGRSPARVVASGSLYYIWLAPAVVAALLFWLRRRNRAMIDPIFAAAMLALAGVAPVLGFVPFTFQAFSTVADHYLYPSMLGVALLVATIMNQVRSPAKFAIAAVIVLLLAFQSYRTTSWWKDSDALFAHTLEVNPRSAMAHTNWAVSLARHDQPAAIEHLQQATLIDPDYAFAHFNLAGLLLKNNDRAGAVREYREVLRIYQSQRNYDSGLASNVRNLIARLESEQP